MYKYSLLFIGLFLFACQNKETNTSLLNNATCSTISEENGVKVFNNFYYEIFENEKVFLVNKKSKLSEPLKSNFTIIPIMPKEDSAKWSINFVAEKYTINNNTLLTESNAPEKVSSYVMYSLNNGSLLLPYSYDKFSVLFSDETQKRWIGFYSKNGANIEESNLKFDNKTVGYLTYANQTNQLEQISIKVNDAEWIEKLDISAPVIELMPVSEDVMSMPGGKTLYFSDMEKAIDFKIQITFYDKEDYSPHVIVIPVLNDKIGTPEFDSGKSIFVI
ncbi:MAG: hypothetical protein KDE33_27145 [Bacteroidetes bacterium]|nr:hypothetical protein [Bacteroidota bacterium]